MDYNGCKIADLRIFYLFYAQLVDVGSSCTNILDIDTNLIFANKPHKEGCHRLFELKNRDVHIWGKSFACARSNPFQLQ